MNEYIFGVLTEPAKTMRMLNEKKPVKEVFFTVVVIQLFVVISNMGQMQASFSDYFGTEGAGGLLGVGGLGFIFLGLALTVAGWVCLTGIYSVLADIFLHKNESRGLLCCLGMAMLPQIFWPPLKIIAKGLEINLLPFDVAVLGWVAFLQVLAIKETFEVRGGMAFSLWLAPWVAIFVIMVTVIASFVGFIGFLR